MSVKALGYLGVGASQIDDWTSYATAQLGRQPVDRGAAVQKSVPAWMIAKQRLIVDGSLAKAANGSSAGGGCRCGGTGCACRAAGSGRRCRAAGDHQPCRPALRWWAGYIQRSGRQSAGGVPQRSGGERSVSARARHRGWLPVWLPWDGPRADDGAEPRRLPGVLPRPAGVPYQRLHCIAAEESLF